MSHTLNLTWQEVLITYEQGRFIKTMAHSDGTFAIHKEWIEYDGKLKQSDYYVVTYLPSSTVLASFSKFNLAKQYLELFLSHGVEFILEQSVSGYWYYAASKETLLAHNNALEKVDK